MITIPGTIPIRIHPFFWLLMAFIGWINSGTVLGTFLWAIVIFISVLIHEYGHALTAIAFGQKAYIELVGLGGVTHREGKRLRLWKEFLIVLNGPLAGFCLYLIAYQLWMMLGANPSTNVYTYLVKITMYANLFWTIVNLLPIHPLDGGKLLSIFLESLFGIRGAKLSFLLSGLLSIGISLLFFSAQAILPAFIFLLLAFESYRAWQGSRGMTEYDQNTDVHKKFQEAEENIKQNKEQEAFEKFNQIRNEAKEGLLYMAATEQIAMIMNKRQQYREAYELLDSLEGELSPEGLHIYHHLAFMNGHIKDAIALGKQAYNDFPNYDTALINALSHASMGEIKPALGWLQRALNDGLPNLSTVLKRKEFDPIRQNPDFRSFMQKHAS